MGVRKLHCGEVPLTRVWPLALALAGLLVCRASRAGTEAFEAAVPGLASASSDDIARAATAIAASADPRALSLLQALDDEEVKVTDSGRAYLKDASGAWKNAVTGAPPGAEALHDASVDNELRRTLDPLIVHLQLASPDPEVRKQAVDSLGRSADENDVAALRAALEREKVRSIRRTIVQVLAENDLSSDDPAKRLAAVKAVEESGSPDFAPKLEALLRHNADGSPAEPDGGVRAAAERAVRSLHRKQFFIDGAADVLYGLSAGSILLLSALGLAITFGLMRVINMAHGEMIMLGAYATYATQEFFKSHLPDHLSLYLCVAVPMALVTSMAVGALLERTVIRFLYGRPLETLLATYGLSLLLIQIVRTVFGAQNVEVGNPPWLSGGSEIFEDVVLPYNRVAIVLFTVAVVSFVAYVLRGTSLGLRVRAVTQNRSMAACMGISTARVDTWTFALGCGVGGLGGVALTQLGNVGPELGQGVIVDSFLVVVLGGVGKLAGTVVAAFGLGILNKLLEPMVGAVVGKIVVLVAVVLVIQKRPQGLFAPRGRSAEGT
jgi:urea transport system permease protein